LTDKENRAGRSECNDDQPFWQVKSLQDMNLDEWDALCDGCAKCCLHKLEDEDTGELAFTSVACSQLDIASCRCRNYAERTFLVDDCVELTKENLSHLKWLPPTCAYRLIYGGKLLFNWHPLMSGDPESVHQAGISVRGKAVEEGGDQDLEDHIVKWPEQDYEEDFEEVG